MENGIIHLPLPAEQCYLGEKEVCLDIHFRIIYYLNYISFTYSILYQNFQLTIRFVFVIGDRDDRDEDGVKRKKKKKKDRDGALGSGGSKTTGIDLSSGKQGSKINSSETGEIGCAADGESLIEEELHMMDELSSAEKVIHCQVSLMEINRKLCAVIGQPC